MNKLAISTLFAAFASARDKDQLNGPDYISLSRQDKSDKIWSKITEDPEEGDWHLAQTLLVDQNPVFDTEGDQLKCSTLTCRKKTTHSVGRVAKAEWIDLGGHPYTGMFRGADAGYVRMSTAAPSDADKPYLIPSMGVKLLRDGYDSGNVQMQQSTDGQASMNWFADDFTNHLNAPGLKFLPLEKVLATATVWIQQVGLSEFATYDQYGNAEESPLFPWMLRMAPTGEFSFPVSSAEGSTGYMDDLATIPAGSTLYDIYAWDNPEELGGTEQLIGRLNTVTDLVTTNFGDEKLYFRHTRMDLDLEIRPEWHPYSPVFGKRAMTSLEQMETGSDCPFSKILEYLQ